MRNKYVAIAAAIVAVIVIGQLLAYMPSRGDCSISTDVVGGNVSYDIDTGYDTIASEIHLRNHNDVPKRYMVLYDEGYGTNVGYNELKPTVYLLSNYLKRCDGVSFETGSVEKITEMIDSSLSAGTFDTGLVILTGAIPDTVFDGTSSSKIVQWMNAGGYLIWSGNSFGRFISNAGGVTETGDYGTLCTDLFGTDNVFKEGGDEDFVFDTLNGPITDAMKLTYNRVSHGIDMSKVTDTLFLGYTDGTYASIGIMGFGSGMLTVFGGPVTFAHVYDIVNITSAGLTEQSELISVSDHKITNGKMKGDFDDEMGATHIIMLHELVASRIWVYDRAEGRFI